MLLEFQSYLYSYNVNSKEIGLRQVWDGNSGGGGHLSKEMPPTRSCTIDAFFQKNAGGPHPGNLTPEPTLRTTHPSLSRRIWILTLAFTSFAILGQLLNFSKYQFSLPFWRAKFLSQFYVPSSSLTLLQLPPKQLSCMSFHQRLHPLNRSSRAARPWH